MSTRETIDSKVDAAVAAIGNEDYAAAERLLRQASVMIAALPDGSQGGQSYRYDRAAIREMLTEVRRARHAAAGGLRFSKIKYQREVSE